jgi:hypothetical protein
MGLHIDRRFLPQFADPVARTGATAPPAGALASTMSRRTLPYHSRHRPW